MATKKSSSRTGRRRGRVETRWKIAGAVAVIVGLALALFWLARPREDHSALAARIAAAKTKGDPNAAVVVEEWSDFQ
ncbi:MAG: hypothetical protein IT307_17400 [Chloroflexi bacterium]|nr:hypothetical protein [Chloroflexota bacterium]